MQSLAENIWSPGERILVNCLSREIIGNETLDCFHYASFAKDEFGVP